MTRCQTRIAVKTSYAARFAHHENPEGGDSHLKGGEMWGCSSSRLGV